MIKNIFLIIQFVYLMIMGLFSWHLSDNHLTYLWLAMIIFYIISAIFLRKYLFILLFFVCSCLLFPLSINPYTYYVIQSGVIEKKLFYEGNTIFIIKFIDHSSVTILDGKDQQCIGREYERKVYCRMIISLIEDGRIRQYGRQ